MSRFSKYLRPYRKEAVLAPLFKLLEASFELLVPLVMARIIDIGIAEGNRDYVFKMGLVLIFFGITGLASAVTAQYYSAKAAAGIGTALRDDLFRHIMSFSHADAGIFGTSTLITRITNDTNQIQTGINLFFRLVLRAPIIVFGAMIMAFTISGREGVVFLCIITILFLIVFLIMRVTVNMYRAVQKKTDRILSDTSENLTGVRVLRAFSCQEHEKKAYREASDDLASMQIYTGKVSALFNPLTYAVVDLGIAAVLYSGAFSVRSGSLSQGEIVALVNYMSQILLELIKISNLVISLSKASACAKRIDEVFEQKTTMVEGDEADPIISGGNDIPAVEFSNVGFTYPGASKEAISDISFSAMQGETIGIIGGTGSGKTTLVSLIPRLYDASRGNVSVNGHDVRCYTTKSLRRFVGITEQGASLFKGTIASNLRWGCETAGEAELTRVVTESQSCNIVEALNDGLNARVLQQGKNFSGGQRQRLAVARTLLCDPGILILDDSSSALDFATDAALRKAIRKDKENRTLILVSQRVSSIRHADKIIVLEDGRVAGIGHHDELIRDCALYREICLSQLTEEEAGI